MATTAREIDAHVGQRMRERREFLWVSQARLGHHLGLTFSQVQKYEKGKNRIGAGRLYLLAEFLDVPVQYFFGGLAPGSATKSRSGSLSGVHGAELAVLDQAFLAIADPDTRQALLALVRSLAVSADPAGRPEQSAG